MGTFNFDERDPFWRGHAELVQAGATPRFGVSGVRGWCWRLASRARSAPARGRVMSQRRRASALVRFCHWLRRPMPE